MGTLEWVVSVRGKRERRKTERERDVSSLPPFSKNSRKRQLSFKRPGRRTAVDQRTASPRPVRPFQAPAPALSIARFPARNNQTLTLKKKTAPANRPARTRKKLRSRRPRRRRRRPSCCCRRRRRHLHLPGRGRAPDGHPRAQPLQQPRRLPARAGVQRLGRPRQGARAGAQAQGGAERGGLDGAEKGRRRRSRRRRPARGRRRRRRRRRKERRRARAGRARVARPGRRGAQHPGHGRGHDARRAREEPGDDRALGHER